MRSLMIGAFSALFTTAAMAQMQNTGPLNKDLRPALLLRGDR